MPDVFTVFLNKDDNDDDDDELDFWNFHEKVNVQHIFVTRLVDNTYFTSVDLRYYINLLNSNHFSWFGKLKTKTTTKKRTAFLNLGSILSNAQWEQDNFLWLRNI